MDYGIDTPVARDALSRALSEVFNEQTGVDIGFQSLFGRNGNEHWHPYNDTTDITIRRGKRRTASLGLRGMHGESQGFSHRILEGDSGTEISRVFPISKQEMAIEAKEINRRMVGEPNFGGMIPPTRMRALAVQKQIENNSRIVRLNERLAAQVLLEGVQDAVLDTSDTDQQYDFYRNSNNAITIADGSRWQAAAALPGDDLDDACDAVMTNGNIRPDVAIFGSTAWLRMQTTTWFIAEKASRNWNVISGGLGVNAPSGYEWMVEAGFDYQGTLLTPKGRRLHCFTYEATYDAYDYDAGTDTSTVLMPVVKVLVLATKAILAKHWGPPDTLSMSPSDRMDMMSMFGYDINNPDLSGVPNLKSGYPLNGVYYDCYRPEGNGGVVIRAQVAPLFVPVQTDAIATIENAGTDNS
jgi:hypothetical protein